MNNYMKVIINALKQWFEQALMNKVDVVDGKGLSTEDFTTEHKNKLESLDVGRQITEHNTSTDAHADIRESISDLNTLVGDAPVSEQITDAINGIEIPEGFSGSWNDLTDKPFYEENNQTIIEWDGSTDGRESFVVSDRTYYKISDNTPSADDITASTFELSNGDSVSVTSELFTGFTNGMAKIGDYLYVVDESTYTGDGNLSIAYSDGIYACAIDGVYPSKFTYGAIVVHELEEKFIPDTIARTSDNLNADWAQNDTSAKDYVKNRTHYSYKESDALIFEGKYVLESETERGDGKTIYRTLVTLENSERFCNEELIVGEVYFLHALFDFTNVQELYLELKESYRGKYLGNLNLLDRYSEDTGEECCVWIPTDGKFEGAYLLTTSRLLEGGYNAWLKGAVRKYSTINENFIPETIARVSELPEGFSGSWSDLEDKPFGDTEPVYETVVENVEVAMTVVPEESGNYSIGTIVEYADSDMLVAGERYKIVINDVEYFVIGECAYDTSRKYGGLGSIPEDLLPYVKDMKSDVVAILGDDIPFTIQYNTPESEKALSNYNDNYGFGSLRIHHDAPVDSVITLSIYRVVSDAKKIDIKYLNKPDWNQFDNNADDYIKNKPFERMENEEVLIFDETVSFSAGNSCSRNQFPNIFTESQMSINDTFIVVWDGIRYECRAWYRGPSEVYLGNIQSRYNLYPITSDLPFCIEGGFGNAYGIWFYLVDTPQLEETHTIQIYKIAPSWACAEEFLPFTHGDWEENNFSSPNYIVNRPFHRELYEDRAIISSMVRTYVGMGTDIYVTTAQMSYQPILGKTYKSRFGAKTADFTTSICKTTYLHIGEGFQHINYCGNLSMFMSNKEDTGEDHLVMFNCNLLTNEFMLGTATIMCKNGSDTYSSTLKGPSYDYHTLDVNYLPLEIARKTDILQSDWNQNNSNAVDFVKNRTHYLEDMTIYYGGITTTDSITVDGNKYYKPKNNDLMPEISNMIGGAVRIYNSGSYSSSEIAESSVTVGDGAEKYGGAVIIVRNVDFNFDGTSYTAPSTGVYFIYASSSLYANELVYKVPKPLDEKFIPDSIARTSQLPAPAAAVPDAAGEAPTAAEFNALLAALRAAGYLTT